MKNIIKDRLSLKGKTPQVPMPEFDGNTKKNRTLWRRTEVLCSNGDVIINPKGKSSFAPGCPFTVSENMVPIGGVQYTMQQLFGIPTDSSSSILRIPTLYDLTEHPEEWGIPTEYPAPIGRPNSSAPDIDNDTESYLIPPIKRTSDPSEPVVTKKVVPYRLGHRVQLFGIGITGTAENDITVYPVNYRECSMDIEMAGELNQSIRGVMVPFRYTSTQLTESERRQYFGKMTNPDTEMDSFYLKTFDTEPVIKHVWKSGEDLENEEENEVDQNDVWVNTTDMNAIESFTEIIIKITKNDAKEWFASLNEEDRARVNTIALFSGEYVKEDSSDDGDFRDVMLFSKLNIPVEYLTMSKDLNIIYRVYES
jgi:hypothetical protein